MWKDVILVSYYNFKLLKISMSIGRKRYLKPHIPYSLLLFVLRPKTKERFFSLKTSHLSYINISACDYVKNAFSLPY